MSPVLRCRRTVSTRAVSGVIRQFLSRTPSTHVSTTPRSWARCATRSTTSASQGGLALVDNGAELIATNPGSNTVSVFDVDGPYLRLDQQIPSGGSFPVSITSHDGLVAVLNSGGTGSVSEYRMHGGRLDALGNETRSLGLANTTPPFFLAGAGQVGYSPNGQFLIATTRSSTSSYEVFSSDSGATCRRVRR